MGPLQFDVPHHDHRSINTTQSVSGWALHVQTTDAVSVALPCILHAVIRRPAQEVEGRERYRIRPTSELRSSCAVRACQNKARNVQPVLVPEWAWHVGPTSFSQTITTAIVEPQAVGLLFLRFTGGIPLHPDHFGIISSSCSHFDGLPCAAVLAGRHHRGPSPRRSPIPLPPLAALLPKSEDIVLRCLLPESNG